MEHTVDETKKLILDRSWVQAELFLNEKIHFIFTYVCVCECMYVQVCGGTRGGHKKTSHSLELGLQEINSSL